MSRGEERRRRQHAAYAALTVQQLAVKKRAAIDSLRALSASGKKAAARRVRASIAAMDREIVSRSAQAARSIQVRQAQAAAVRAESAAARAALPLPPLATRQPGWWESAAGDRW
ncbi:hypothetical protein AB0O22_31865 [Streptomyces sp. NPDC091204]|uniref:hypothetical protein n=1 Tax=Streptomyces sp. NPDC091204 TaxID=3155299 RepID=UPI00342E4011